MALTEAITTTQKKRGFGSVPVPQAAEVDPQLNDATKEAILKLLKGEGFSNIDASRNIIRGESKNALKQSAIRRGEDFGARGLFGSGAQVRDIERIERDNLGERFRALNDLETANEQLGLQKTAQGIQGFGVQQGVELTRSQQAIARALGINDQQLRDLISKRQAGADRARTQASLTISENQLALQKLLGLEDIGLRREGLDLQKLLGLEDVRQGDERNRIAELLGLGDLDLGQGRLDLSTEQFESDRALNEFLQSLALGSLPGFGSGASAGNPAGLPQDLIDQIRAGLAGGNFGSQPGGPPINFGSGGQGFFAQDPFAIGGGF